jgi:hypothetical protein
MTPFDHMRALDKAGTCYEVRVILRDGVAVEGAPYAPGAGWWRIGGTYVLIQHIIAITIIAEGEFDGP